jgi:peptide/nickel transport system ATP-binding protein
MPDDSVILEVDNVSVTYGFGRRRLKAVDEVSLKLHRGEVVGLIGETGSGKTTLLRAMAGLTPITSGAIRRSLDADQSGQRKSSRPGIQVVFQNSLAALNPRQPIWKSVIEPIEPRKFRASKELRPRAVELLESVGLGPESAERLPAQMSGGQRQRVTIARALAAQPPLILLDEPVASLDVSLQAGILQLLAQLRTELQLSYFMISHDVGAVARLADRVAVMYLGKIVEIGAAEEVTRRPQHPYTQALMSAVPRLGHAGRARIKFLLADDLPDPRKPPSGCRFRTRCPHAIERCSLEIPHLREIPSTVSHVVACHRWEELFGEGDLAPVVDAV